MRDRQRSALGALFSLLALALAGVAFAAGYGAGGHAGRWVIAEVLEASDEHFQFRFEGRCGYEATFAYAGP